MHKILVDVGRRYVRFGHVDQVGQIVDQGRKATADSNPYSLVHDYAVERGIELRRSMVVVAAPGPFKKDELAKRTTYIPMGMPEIWQLSERDLDLRLRIANTLMFHDMAAVAVGLERPAPWQLRTIAIPVDDSPGPRVVIQTGIGLGLAVLIPTAAGGWFPFTGEGGSQFVAPLTEEEREIFELAQSEHPLGWKAPTAQHLLSAAMLPHIYSRFGGTEPSVEPEYVSENAASCPVCRKAMNAVAGLLGTFAADAAMTFAGKGGVYIGGGLAAALDEECERTLMDRFVERGLAKLELAKIPVHIITDEYETLSGLAILADRAKVGDR